MNQRIVEDDEEEGVTSLPTRWLTVYSCPFLPSSNNVNLTSSWTSGTGAVQVSAHYQPRLG